MREKKLLLCYSRSKVAWKRTIWPFFCLTAFYKSFFKLSMFFYSSLSLSLSMSLLSLSLSLSPSLSFAVFLCLSLYMTLLCFTLDMTLLCFTLFIFLYLLFTHKCNTLLIWTYSIFLFLPPSSYFWHFLCLSFYLSIFTSLLIFLFLICSFFLSLLFFKRLIDWSMNHLIK